MANQDCGERVIGAKVSVETLGGFLVAIED